MEIKLNILTRVEGEGALKIYLKDGKLVDVDLNIFEPPRFFESILKGKEYIVIPDITARICGICPVAYQISGVQAIESIFKVEIPKELEDLRRLIYYGEWIQSHVLHIFFLHLPDFLNLNSFIDIVKTYPNISKIALNLKKVSQRMLEIIGGRPSHPVSIKVGGFHKVPNESDIKFLIKDLEDSYNQSLDAMKFLVSINFPDHRLNKDFTFISLQEEKFYPILKGKIVTSDGLKFEKEEFLEFIQEYEKEKSTAKYSCRKDGKKYIVGPVARFNNNYEYLTENTKKICNKFHIYPSVYNMSKSILIRMIEVIDSIERSILIINNYKKLEKSSVEYEVKEGEGTGISEAPRGILWHMYRLDKEGKILQANIIPPTSQNQEGMEYLIKSLISGDVVCNGENIQTEAEKAVRDFDPCISCATHFLKISLTIS